MTITYKYSINNSKLTLNSVKFAIQIFLKISLTKGMVFDFGFIEQPVRVEFNKYLIDFNRSVLIWFLNMKSGIMHFINLYIQWEFTIT